MSAANPLSTCVYTQTSHLLDNKIAAAADANRPVSVCQTFFSGMHQNIMLMVFHLSSRWVARAHNTAWRSSVCHTCAHRLKNLKPCQNQNGAHIVYTPCSSSDGLNHAFTIVARLSNQLSIQTPQLIILQLCTCLRPLMAIIRVILILFVQHRVCIILPSVLPFMVISLRVSVLILACLRCLCCCLCCYLDAPGPAHLTHLINQREHPARHSIA